MRVSIGNDHHGYQLKCDLVERLADRNWQVDDRGSHDGNSVDYPDIAQAVAREVGSGRSQRGILICGTGIGMAIAANKIDGVRAAVCRDANEAEMSRRHNDANVLCLPGKALETEAAERLVDVWLDTEFEGGRHQRRVDKIADIARNSACGDSS